MNKYENLVIFNASLSDEDKDKIIAKYTTLIEKSSGKINVINKWGIKKFAYPINYKNEGFYVLFEFESAADLPCEMNALMRIDENVMRNLCIRK